MAKKEKTMMAVMEMDNMPDIRFQDDNIPKGDHKVGEIKELTLKMKCTGISERKDMEGKICKTVTFELVKGESDKAGETAMKKKMQRSSAMEEKE